jgi:phosphoglucomutase
LWSKTAAVGKTIVSSQMIDRITAKLGRKLFEVPVGFKWFVDGLLDGSLGFAGEESAGSVFLRLNGSVWTTDKDGMVPCLLAAEMTARTGHDPAAIYREFTREFGEHTYERIDSPATPEQKIRLAKLSPPDVKLDRLAGEAIESILTLAPGNDAPIGGLKVMAEHGWFAVRPSGTEEVCKVYAESSLGSDHLCLIQADAQTVINAVLAAVPVPEQARDKPLSGLHQMTEKGAIEVWSNEGDPN